MQSTAAAGGRRVGGERERGEEIEEKRVRDKTQRQKWEVLFKMHSLENNIQDHLHESGCSGELDKAATKSAEHFDTKDFGKQSTV